MRLPFNHQVSSGIGCPKANSSVSLSVCISICILGNVILPPTVSHVKSIISFSATGPMTPLAMMSFPLLRIRGDDGGTVMKKKKPKTLMNVGY